MIKGVVGRVRAGRVAIQQGTVSRWAVTCRLSPCGLLPNLGRNHSRARSLSHPAALGCPRLDTNAQTLVQATAQQDGELLDSITTATFEYDVGPLAPAVREIRDEYMCMARDCRLKETQEEAATEAFYVFDPVLNRRPQTAAEIAGITAPTLILQVRRPRAGSTA